MRRISTKRLGPLTKLIASQRRSSATSSSPTAPTTLGRRAARRFRTGVDASAARVERSIRCGSVGFQPGSAWGSPWLPHGTPPLAHESPVLRLSAGQAGLRRRNVRAPAIRSLAEPKWRNSARRNPWFPREPPPFSRRTDHSVRASRPAKPASGGGTLAHRRYDPWPSRSGGTGRRAGLKIRCPKGRVGSIPTFGTRIQAVSPLYGPSSLATR